MNITNTNTSTSRGRLAAGLVSVLIAGGVLSTSSAAVADQNGGDGGSTVTSYAGPDTDEQVALRKVAMAQAFADRR